MELRQENCVKVCFVGSLLKWWCCIEIEIVILQVVYVVFDGDGVWCIKCVVVVYIGVY